MPIPSSLNLLSAWTGEWAKRYWDSAGRHFFTTFFTAALNVLSSAARDGRLHPDCPCGNGTMWPPVFWLYLTFGCSVYGRCHPDAG